MLSLSLFFRFAARELAGVAVRIAPVSGTFPDNRRFYRKIFKSNAFGRSAVNRPTFKAPLNAATRELVENILLGGPVFQALKVTMKAPTDLGVLLMNNDGVVSAGEHDGACEPRGAGANDADD